MAAAAPPNTISYPQLVDPQNGATFTSGQRVTFAWKPVSGAQVVYFLSFQIENAAHEWVNGDDYAVRAPNTTHTIQVHYGHYRWYVFAYDLGATNPSDPNTQTPAAIEWRTFTVKLETPRLVAPPAGARLRVALEQTFKWTEVDGADSYRVYWQKRERYQKEWKPAGYDWSYLNHLHKNFPLSQHGYDYRWQVIAFALDQSLNSDPSEWRTFELVLPPP